MRPQKIFLIILVVYLSGFLAHALLVKQTVYGDGIFYYSWLRSAVVDHDFDFRNEYHFFGVNQPETPLGYAGNKYSVGPAALWAPAFIWTRALIGGSGYELPYQLAIGGTGVLYAVSGLILLYLLLGKFFRPSVSLSVVLSLAFATNLFFYGSLDTVNSHALSFFAVTLLLTFLFGKTRCWFLVGAALGLLGIIRPQDLLYSLLVLPFLNLQVIIGFLLIFGLQLIAWQIFYGQLWFNPYLAGGEGFRWPPQILGVLFSPANGFFLWTPMALIALMGLLISANTKRARNLNRLFVLIAYLQILLVASWSTWWQGASYSGRMFLGILPVLAFGLANLFSWLGSKGMLKNYLLLSLVIPLSVINFIGIVFFLLKT